jgi:hypothetical protein
MSRATRIRLTLFLAVMAWMMALPPAQAYVDGGSLTILFQAVVAGIAAAGTAVAVFWTRIKRFFRRGDRDAGGDRATEQV